MDALNIALVVIVLLVAAGVYLNNKQHTLYASVIAQLTSLVGKGDVTHTVNVGGTPSGGSTTTISVPAGFALGAGNVLLQPVTPAALFATFLAACSTAGLGAGVYTNGFGTWNQMEYLRQLDAPGKAAWVADALKLPAIGGGGNTFGGIAGLSNDGQGFFEALAAQVPTVVLA